MTTVLVDARNITADPTGVGRYARALLPRMIAERPDWQWVVLRHQSNREPLFDAREVFVASPIDGLQNYLRGGAVFRDALGGHSADVVHSLFHILPRKFARPARTVVTAHDFIWIDHPEISQRTALGAFTTARFARRAIPDALRAADVVIAVSEATATRATRWIDRSKIRTSPHGVEPRYFEALPPDDAIVEHLRRDHGRYIVAVGNDKQYKNLQTLVRAFAQLRDRSCRLVLVGRCDGVVALAGELGVADRVIAAGRLDDVDLRRVVGNATCFVFPSLVEGFGLPPLEAMALGVPTIVSDLEPMRSVAGEAALRFEPTDAGALAVLIGAVLDDRILRERLAEDGRARAREFDWDVTARETLRAYEVS